MVPEHPASQIKPAIEIAFREGLRMQIFTLDDLIEKKDSSEQKYLRLSDIQPKSAVMD